MLRRPTCACGTRAPAAQPSGGTKTAAGLGAVGRTYRTAGVPPAAAQASRLRRGRDSATLLESPAAMKATLEELEKGTAEYLHRVMDGETVVVYQGKRAVAEIRPLTETAKLRPVGLAEGEFVVPDDFDDPLPDDMLDAFEGR